MAKKKNIVHVYAYGDVCPVQGDGEQLNDFGIISLSSIRAQVQLMPEAEVVRVHIHSPGGDVNEGFAIYDYLTGLGLTIETINEGLCASIATIIHLAGSVRLMLPNAKFHIHNPWMDPFTMTEFTAEDYYSQGDKIKAAETKMLNFYVARTGAPEETISAIMKAKTDVLPDQALELKLITQLPVEPKAQAQIKAYLNSNPLQNSAMKKELKEISDALAAINAKLKPGAQGSAGAQGSTKQVELQDATFLTVEVKGTEPAVGDMCTVDGNPAPDGDYILKDGTTYVVTGGAIEEIQAPSAAAGEGQTVASLTAENTRLTNELAAANQKLAAQEADIKGLVKSVNEIKSFVTSSGFKPVQRTVQTGSKTQQADAQGAADDDDDSKLTPAQKAVKAKIASQAAAKAKAAGANAGNGDKA
jgi:ATP-dependent protease ClpP protease subunit